MLILGCLFGLFAAFAPRLAFLLFWLARPNQVNAAFNTFIFPCLGLIFLPFTTLMWVLLWTPVTGIQGWDWLWIGIAVLLDIWGWANGGRVGWSNRNAIPGYSGSSSTGTSAK